MSRLLGLLSLVLLALAAAGCIGQRFGARSRRDHARCSSACTSSSPRGSRGAEMADRVEAVRTIAIAKRGVTPRLTKTGYLVASGRRAPRRSFART